MNNTFALITGASFGIGKEIAKVMAAHKHNLILTARSEAPLHALAKELEEQYHISTHIIVCDLCAPEAAYQLCKEIENLDCSIDILVNNAGFGVYGEFIDSDLSKQQDLIQLNCIALTHISVKRFHWDSLLSFKNSYPIFFVRQKMFSRIHCRCNRYLFTKYP